MNRPSSSPRSDSKNLASFIKMMPKKGVVAVALFVVVVVGGWYYYVTREPSSTSIALSPLNLEASSTEEGSENASLLGAPVDLSKLCAKAGGKPLYVDVWATWCPYCVRDMQALAALARHHVSIAFVSVDHNPRVVKELIEEKNLQDLDVYMDPKGEFSKTFGVRGLPVVYKFSKNCTLVEKHAGPLDAATIALFFDVNLKNI